MSLLNTNYNLHLLHYTIRKKYLKYNLANFKQSSADTTIMVLIKLQLLHIQNCSSGQI